MELNRHQRSYFPLPELGNHAEIGIRQAETTLLGNGEEQHEELFNNLNIS